MLLSPALEKRLRALEQLYASMGECSCRVNETIFYHNSVELQAILQASCAVHGFRQLGELMWVGSVKPRATRFPFSQQDRSSKLDFRIFMAE